MEITFSEEEKRQKYWIAVRSQLIFTIDYEYQQAAAAGCLLEPLLDFLGFHYFYRLFNIVLIPVSRVDLQKKHSSKDSPTPLMLARIGRIWISEGSPTHRE